MGTIKHLTVGATAAVALLLAWAMPLSAKAAAEVPRIPDTCDNFGAYFDGMNSNTISTSGAQANVYNYDPRIASCTNGDNGSSSAWAMIYRDSNSNELAQIGWLKLQEWSTTNVWFFWEYGTSSVLNPPFKLYVDTGDLSYGTSSKFTVYTNGSNVTLFLINNTGYANARLGWTPDRAAWLAETHHYDDQTAGDTAHEVLFCNVQHLYNGNWYNDIADLNAYNTSPYGTGYWGSSNAMDVWDTRYNSEA